jgi:O-methyltransferase involved in polyketide biosynthesis
LGWEIPAGLHFVPVDFTKEGLVEALGRSSYDSQGLSFFNWMGVTYYLPRQAVLATLRAIADVAPAGSTVVFDYSDSGAVITEREAKRRRYLYMATRRIGELLMTSLEASTLSSELACRGLCLHEDLGQSDIEGRFFQGCMDRYHAHEASHFARAIVK